MVLGGGTGGSLNSYIIVYRVVEQYKILQKYKMHLKILRIEGNLLEILRI